MVDGNTPFIERTANWIGETDTGVKLPEQTVLTVSTAKRGDKGDKGDKEMQSERQLFWDIFTERQTSEEVLNNSRVNISVY